MSELSEAKVKQYVDKICGKQSMEGLRFYCEQDKPLGDFINDKIATAGQRCETCKRPNFMHYHCFYMLDGRLKLSMSVNKERSG